MDYRAKLLDKISKSILQDTKDSQDIANFIKEVLEYDSILEDTLRNYYEVREESPLFNLCYYLKEGRACFYSEDEDYLYKNKLDSLLSEVNAKFNTNIFMKAL